MALNGMRKVIVFLIGLLLYILIYIYYKNNKAEIIEWIYKSSPRLYTSNNSNQVTVSFYHSDSTNYTLEDEILLPNAIFQYKPVSFHIDDTDKIMKSRLKCIPNSFGYRQDEGNKIFPKYNYRACKEITGISSQLIKVDTEQRKFSANCPRRVWKLISGPYSQDKFVDYTDIGIKESTFNGPFTDKVVEFVFGHCKDDKKEYMNVLLDPVFNAAAYNKAKEKILPGRPKIIYFINLDSISRKHFFRKLPTVINSLNNLNKTYPHMAAYDFKYHNIFGLSSIENQIPILDKYEKNPPRLSGKPKDKFGKEALWNVLREKGYISLIGSDDCENEYSGVIGKNPNVDYSVRQFYCIAKKLNLYNYWTDSLKPKCIGQYTNHYYLLQYVHSVARLNQGVNQFFYIHLNAGNEKTGQHANTLDNDLAYFIEQFLNEYGEENDIAIFLQADRGNINYKSNHGIDGNMEFKLPALFLIIEKDILKDFPYSYHTLQENSERLILKQDLRETILAIAGIEEKTNGSINIISEISPLSRDCGNLLLSSEYCTCKNKMREIIQLTDTQSLLVDRLKAYAEYEINSLAYSVEKNYIHKICKKIILDQVQTIYHSELSSVIELYRMNITSSTTKNIKFEVDFFISSDQKMINLHNSTYRIENLVFDSFPIQVKVCFK